QLRTQSQRATPAWRLNRTQAAGGQRGVPLAEDQPFHRLIESGVAGRSDVSLGRLAREQLTLRLADGPHDRRLAGIVAENADAQVHLARIRIGAEGGHDAKNGIRRQPVEMLEHACLLAAGLRQENEFTRPSFTGSKSPRGALHRPSWARPFGAGASRRPKSLPAIL